MPIRVTEFESTPNPNALKCMLDRRVSEERRSYSDASAAAADPIAARLFAVEGVVGVMLLGDWLTVLKAPDAPWRAIRAGVTRALAGAD
jgi:hypothetical protein